MLARSQSLRLFTWKQSHSMTVGYNERRLWIIAAWCVSERSKEKPQPDKSFHGTLRTAACDQMWPHQHRQSTVALSRGWRSRFGGVVGDFPRRGVGISSSRARAPQRLIYYISNMLRRAISSVIKYPRRDNCIEPLWESVHAFCVFKPMEPELIFHSPE